MYKELLDFEIDIMEILINLDKKHDEFLEYVKAHPEEYDNPNFIDSTPGKVIEDMKKTLELICKKEILTINDYITIRFFKTAINAALYKVHFCPINENQLESIMACQFCSFGHMARCHFPFDCDSEYCNKYQEEFGEFALPASDGLTKYREMVLSAYMQVIDAMSEKAKELIGKLEYYIPIEDPFICAICNKSENPDKKSYVFNSADQNLKICFHQECMIKPKTDLKDLEDAIERKDQIELDKRINKMSDEQYE